MHVSFKTLHNCLKSKEALFFFLYVLDAMPPEKINKTKDFLVELVFVLSRDDKFPTNEERRL